MSGMFPHRQAVINGVVPLASGAFGSAPWSIGFDAVVESSCAAASGRLCENRGGETIDIRAMMEIEIEGWNFIEISDCRKISSPGGL
jgi:hypothetical protein